MCHCETVRNRFQHGNIIVFITKHDTFFRSDSQNLLIFFNAFCLIGIKRNKIHPCCSGSHNCTFVPKAFIPVMNRIVLQSASFIYCQFHTRFRDFFKAIDFLADISNDIDHQISEMFCFRSDIVKIFRGTGKF